MVLVYRTNSSGFVPKKIKNTCVKVKTGFVIQVWWKMEEMYIVLFCVVTLRSPYLIHHMIANKSVHYIFYSDALYSLPSFKRLVKFHGIRQLIKYERINNDFYM